VGLLTAVPTAAGADWKSKLAKANMQETFDDANEDADAEPHSAVRVHKLCKDANSCFAVRVSSLLVAQQ
jgi:hypothetical protein